MTHKLTTLASKVNLLIKLNSFIFKYPLYQKSESNTKKLLNIPDKSKPTKDTIIETP